MPNVVLESDSDILDWLATSGIIEGSFILDETFEEGSDGVTIDYYAVQNDVPLTKAIREVLSLAKRMDVRIQEEVTEE